jgi:hypothetical protein
MRSDDERAGGDDAEIEQRLDGVEVERLEGDGGGEAVVELGRGAVERQRVVEREREREKER